MNERVQPAQTLGFVRTADVISAMSVAADLALGLPAEHSARSCYIAIATARELGLSNDEQGELYYTALLLDAGCTAWTSAFATYIMGDEIAARQDLFFERNARSPFEVFAWLKQHMAADATFPVRAGHIIDFLLNGRERFREGFRNTCEVANRFADRLGMPPGVQHALSYVFEQWDGKGGPSGAAGQTIPITARIANAAIFLEARQHSHGRDAAIRLAKDRRGTAFDPRVADAFLAATERSDFWPTLTSDTVMATVRALEPALPYRFVREDKLLDVALYAADFADLKSRYTTGHARRVAVLAADIARHMALSEDDIASVHLAGLLHDLGLVAIPSFVLEKPQDALAPAEREALRLHPYHAERILARVPVLGRVASIVGAHHERIDGQGFFRGLARAHIPLGARILAVADTFDELTHEGPGRQALDAVAAVTQIQAEAGHAFEPAAIDALVATEAAGAALPRRSASHRTWPSGLTDREVEVLRLAAKGLTNKQMANDLFVSPSTVRTHLEHIYSKIHVSTRAAATLFAVEHDLIA
jgi:HD-GYP domain-containing protein (c-di-GMP phosphodiesterase class II)/DNA-binding CsgD family transcriptional regulator